MSSNPLGLGGGYSGPGGPHDRNAFAVDTSNAVLVDHVGVVLVHATRAGRPVDEDPIGLTLGGRVNQQPARADVLHLLDRAGAAQIIAELFGLASRGGFAASFSELVEQAIDKLDETGAL